LAGADTDDADDSELDKKTPAPDAAIEMAESVAPSAPADS
jgi:hypothetical protein